MFSEGDGIQKKKEHVAGALGKDGYFKWTMMDTGSASRG